MDQGPPSALIGSVIVPTRNRPKELAACLDALLPLPEGVELIVGDDGDTPATRDLLAQKYPQARCVAGPKDGPGANRNRAAAGARGELLIFLDDDCVPRPGLVPAYLAATRKHPGEALAGPTLRCDEHAGSLLWEAPEYHGEGNTLPPSCNFAIPRALFLRHGGFDERLKISYEDIDLFSRLRLEGIPIRFTPDAAAEHPSRPIPSAVKLSRRWEARVICAYDYGAPWWVIAWRLPRMVFLVLLSRLRRRPTAAENPRVIAIYLHKFLAVLWQLPGWLVKHRRGPRSAFWMQKAAEGKTPWRYGL